jgi:hypothetical protein
MDRDRLDRERQVHLAAASQARAAAETLEPIAPEEAQRMRETAEERANRARYLEEQMALIERRAA